MADTKVKVTLGEFLGRFGSAGIAYLATTIDFFALTLALPSMAAELGTTTTALQWTASGYMIATGISMIPGSRIADLIGRRRVLLFGVAIFGLASLWVGLSTTVASVIAARIVQGLGAGLIFPSMMSVISNSTTPTERPKILGMIGALAGLGTALGPVLGGGLSSTVGWRWVFFFNVPLALIAFVWGHFQLQESTDPALSGKRIRNLDFVGTLLIAAGVVGLSLGIDNAGAGALAALVPLGVGVAGVVGLFVWERRSSWPLITQDLLTNGRYKALILAATVGNMGLSVVVFVSTIYLQEVNGYSGMQAGLMFIPAAVGLLIAGPVCGVLASKVPGQRVMAVALLAGALSLGALAIFSNVVVYLILMALTSFLLGVGYEFGTIGIQSVLTQSQSGEGAGVLVTLTVAIGGMAVVIAATILEVVGGAKVDQRDITVTLLCTAAATALFAVIFGLAEWRKATLVTSAAPATAKA